jgi:hypothetical protein
MEQTVTLLSSTLNVHLNVGQAFHVDSAEVQMSLEATSFDALTKGQVSNNQFQLPADIQLNSIDKQSTISIRVRIVRCATFDECRLNNNVAVDDETIGFIWQFESIVEYEHVTISVVVDC